MEIPHDLHWHQQNQYVTDGVEETTGIQKTRDVNARACNGLVPYPRPWRTLPDFGGRGGRIEQADNQHEETRCHIKRTPLTRQKHSAIEQQDR